MSENERVNLFISIKEGLAKATRQMLERKAKLGESVVISDSNGKPVTISAEKALELLNTKA